MSMRHLFCIVLISVPCFATDGMSLEGWGSVSTGLGGASMAYDNGLAGLMNNPATLILLREGKGRFDFSLTQLGPDVQATLLTEGGAYRAESTSDAFYMPAMGWGKRQGKLAYGLGLFAQGGMGCQYEANSWMGQPWGNQANYDHRLVNRSEVSVGRILGGLAYQLNPRFTLAASLDFVWAGLDLQMAMSNAQFMDMANPMAQNGGYAGGSLLETFGQMYEPFGGMGIEQLHYAYFDFSNGSDFTGRTKANGFAGKLGFLWQATNQFSIGGTWHSETSLDDLSSKEASLSMGVAMDTGLLSGGPPSGQYMDVVLPLEGRIAVRDFQWPTTWGLGFSWYHGRYMLAGDVKYLKWADVMSRFDMRFQADEVASNGAFAGMVLDAGLWQHWRNQTVYALGGSCVFQRGFILRAGLNLTDNPIPNTYVNPLFPAIIEKHAMLGLGFDVGQGEVNLVAVQSFNEEVTSPGNGSTIPAVTSSHDQLNWSVQYSWKF